jgi:hypothetical protein
MSTNIRYHVIPDQECKGVTILDSKTGGMQHPACWQDLAAYYYYLTGRGRIDESQLLLSEIMAGNKPITKMLACVSNV